jgi:hypothetical protein
VADRAKLAGNPTFGTIYPLEVAGHRKQQGGAAMTKHPAVRWLILAALWVFVGLALSTEVYFSLKATQPGVEF